MKGKVYIVGAGNFGRELYAWLTGAGVMPSKVLFLDDRLDAKLPWYYPPVVGRLGERQADIFRDARLNGRLEPDDEVYLAVADPVARAELALRLEGVRVQTPCFIHPTAVVASTASIGPGAILCPLSLVSADAQVGAGVHVNTFSSVGHDVKVAPYVTLSSHVDLCGRVEVGTSAFFGSGSRALPGVKVGSRARVSAGAVVAKDVEDGQLVYGPLARAL